MKLGNQDVDKGVAVPAEFGHCEDPGGDDTDGVGCTRIDGGFVDELRDDHFGEVAELVKEESGAVVVGNGGGWLEEKVGHVDLGRGDLRGLSKNFDYLFALIENKIVSDVVFEEAEMV